MPVGLYPRESADILAQQPDQGTSAPPEPGVFAGFNPLTRISQGVQEGGAEAVFALQQDHPAVIGYNLPESAYTKPQELSDDEYRLQLARDSTETLKQFQANPHTVGMAGQTLQGLASGISQFVTGSALGGPVGGAIVVGGSKGKATQRELTAQGVDQSTADALGAANALFAGGASLLPGGYGKGALNRIVTGAGANATSGIVQRGLTHNVLADAGYTAQAQQYQALDANAIIADTVLGAGFGATHHLFSPSAQDAARTIQDADHIETSTPGGAVPATPDARDAHVANMTAAAEALLRGDDMPPLRDVEMVPNPDAASAGEARASAVEEAARESFEAFHGSPYAFDRFDLSNVGNGEGAQAFGYGLYFAERRGVAKSYAVEPKDWYGNPDEPPSVQDSIDWAVYQSGKKTPGEVADFLQDYVKDATLPEDVRNLTEAMNALRAGTHSIRTWGHLYEVKINRNPEDFIDWDKRLVDQPKKIQDAVAQIIQYGSDFTGEDAIRKIAMTPEGAKALHDLGIAGVKYFDGVSREAQEGARNFVLFSDKDVQMKQERRGDQRELARLSELRAKRSGNTLTDAEKDELLTLQERDRLASKVGGRRIQGVQTDEAYAEMMARGEAKPVQGFVDMDMLKALNDSLGHGAGDDAIRTLGETLAHYFGESNVFRRSSSGAGDEFIVQHSDQASYDSAIEAARQHLANHTIRVLDADGNVIGEQKGIGFSHGSGKTVELAEQGAYADKQLRAAQGLRRDRPPADAGGVPAKPAAAGGKSGNPAPARAKAGGKVSAARATTELSNALRDLAADPTNARAHAAVRSALKNIQDSGLDAGSIERAAVARGGDGAGRVLEAARASERPAIDTGAFDPATREAVDQAQAILERRGGEPIAVQDENGATLPATEALQGAVDQLKTAQSDGELARVAAACFGRG